MFSIYTLEEKTKWKNIVDSFENCDIYYYPEYVMAFEKNNDGEPLLIHYQKDNIEAINVVIKRDLSDIPKYKASIEPKTLFDFITPYGYGGILFKDTYSKEDINTFVQHYLTHFKAYGVVSEFIRFNPILNNCLPLEEHLPITYLGPTVAINTTDINTIWDNFSSKNRNKIRKGIKEGVKVYWGLSPLLLETFKTMYINTMENLDAADYYYFSDAFYESLLLDLKYNMLFFYAVYQEEIIAIASILHYKNKAHYHLSGSNINYRHLAPTSLILSELSIYAYNNGIQEIHLGGGLGGEKDSLYKFKKAFNKEEDKRFAVGKIIFNETVYRTLTKDIEEDNFFPLYRKS